jgi:hypothetical protein
MATITLVGISIARVYKPQGPTDQTRFAGIVTLEAKSGGIKFNYEYEFIDLLSAEIALANGIGHLKHELEQLLDASKVPPYGR